MREMTRKTWKSVSVLIVAELVLAAIASVHHVHGIERPGAADSSLRSRSTAEGPSYPCPACTLAEGPASQAIQRVAWIVPQEANLSVDCTPTGHSDQLDRCPFGSRGPPRPV